MFVEELFESITQTVYAEAWDVVKKTTAKWVKTVGRPKIEHLEQPFINFYDEHKDDYKKSDLISDKRMYMREAIQDILKPGTEINDELLFDYKNKIEEALQDYLVDYVEDRYGKIEPYDHSMDNIGSDETKKKNLYFLQHILVQIKLDAVRKSGAPKSGGGDFSQSFHMTSLDSLYAKTFVNTQTDLGININIYTTKNDLGKIIQMIIVDEIDLEYYGEKMSSYVDDDKSSIDGFYKNFLSVFTHEVIHLEQNIRNSNARNKKWFKDVDIGYTPNPNRKKGKAQRLNDKGRYEYYRTGKRGNPTRLGDDDFSDNAFTEYLGTANEIDAHAAQAAATAIGEHLNDRYGYSHYPIDKQIRTNEYVDTIIKDLSYGYGIEGSSSFKSYTDYVKEKIANVDRAIKQKTGRYPVGKVDILHRKVWRLFMTRLVKHLLAYKKPIPWDDEADWRREDMQEPRKAKVGNIHQTKPKLP